MKKIINHKLIIIFLTLVFFIAMIYYRQFNKNDRYEETTSTYLENNIYSLEKNFNEEAFNFLAKDIKSNNLILSLYDKNLEENYKIDFEIIKYLNSTAGAKNYITDLTYSDAFIINQYLKTGDGNVLQQLFKANNWEQKFNNNFYEEIINLYNYNKSLNKNKIEVFGTFPQISTGASCIAIKYMMPNYEPPKNISYYINAFKNNLEGIDTKDAVVDFYLKLKENIKENDTEYKKYFGATFKDFETITNSLIKCTEFVKKNPTNTNYYSFIDSEISEGFKRLQLVEKNEKSYGSFEPIYNFGNTDKGIYMPSIVSNATKYKFTTVRFVDNNISPIKDVSSNLLFDNIKYNKAFIRINPQNPSFRCKEINYLIYVKKSKMTINGSTEERDEIVEYLNRSKASLGNNNNININGLDLIDNDIPKYDIFLTGESHGVKVNKDIQLSFLKCLNKKGNVKYFLCEMGYAQSKLINNYLKTGDKSILEEIMLSLSGTASSNNDYVERWNELYEYNKTLPNDNKIQVIGIDLEHQMNLAINYLNSLVPKEEPFPQILNSIGKVKTCILKRYDYNEIINTYTEINKNINENINIYQTYLGENFFDFKFICENILNTAIFYEEQDLVLREQSIYSNFKQIYGHLPKGKYYGQWGSAHTSLNTSEVDGMKGKNMATMMNEKDSPFYKKVLSIPIMYSNCYSLFNNTRNIVYTNFKNQQGFSLLSEDEVALFKLNGENSPFDKRLYMVKYDKGVTTDYFQYTLFVRNSPAAEPYTGVK